MNIAVIFIIKRPFVRRKTNENTVSVSKQERRNLIAFPIATVGRDMCSQFFSLSVLNFILFTKNLTVEQFSAVSAIIVAARVFDAFNDPIMGTIIDRTHTKIGKFKPWMIAGVITTSMVVSPHSSTI